MSEFKGRLDASDKVIQEIAKKIMDGYFMEVKACEIENDYVLQVRYYRDINTREILKSEPFTEKLQQSDIFDGVKVTVTAYEGDAKVLHIADDNDSDENY